jgi:putative serine/threonine protein kinase
LSHQTRSESIEVGTLDRMPYLGVLTYPRPNLKVAKSRIAQLRRLGVTTVTFEGKTKIGRLGLVGIGTVGIVVKAERGGAECALKIRRTDANREDMAEEFRLTTLANRVGVGAVAQAATRDFMAMEFVKGSGVDEYVRGISGRGRAGKVRELLHAVLNQCRKLDLLGLDHGQLSDLRKHVIVRESAPCIIDFESGSQRRAARNVTTAAQYLLIGGSVSPMIRRIIGLRDTEPVLSALRRYKAESSDESYVRLLSTVGVRI